MQAGIATTLLLSCCIIAPVSAEPPPGHPSAEQAGRLLGLPPARPPGELPYAGTVLKAMDSNAFTYIEVREATAAGATSRWIAAPRIAVAPGARIGYDDGRLMTGFHSRKLDITFESITFVNRVAILDGERRPGPPDRP